MNEDSKKHVVEIKGVKFEIDERFARKIEDFRIGDKIKVLIKKYSNEHKVYPGIIVGFENFPSLPTMVIAYLEMDYSSAELRFAYFNAESGFEISKTDDAYLPIEKGMVIETMDKEILKKEGELRDLQLKKAYFLEHFNHYFQMKEEEAEAEAETEAKV